MSSSRRRTSASNWRSKEVKALAELSVGNQVQKEIAKRERRAQTLERNLTKQLARLAELAPSLEAAGLPSTQSP